VAARLRVKGGMRAGVSQNVIAELPGTDRAAGILFLGAHHDTQAGSVGADDNGVGVAGLIELARVLAPLPRRRAIRLISFGAEEQLSVGSAEYVRRHRREVARRGRLMFNLDAFGSHLGWYELTCNGPAALEQFARTTFERNGVHARIVRDIVPYADHFPFVAAGIPGIWLGRVNCTAGRFFHHRPDDNMTRVSAPRMAATLDAVATFVAELAQTAKLPFPVRIPPSQRDSVAEFWRDLFGGWSGQA
jgi:Zn-dependent M28 family amino/carboxypeptidase